MLLKGEGGYKEKFPFEENYHMCKVWVGECMYHNFLTLQVIDWLIDGLTGQPISGLSQHVRLYNQNTNLYSLRSSVVLYCFALMYSKFASYLQLKKTTTLERFYGQWI